MERTPEDKARRAKRERLRRAGRKAAGVKVERSDEYKARQAKHERDRRKLPEVQAYYRGQKKKYREENRDKFREYSREHQRKRRAKLKELGLKDPHAPTPEWHKAYRERDPIRYAYMRRASTYKMSVEDQEAMAATQNNRCANLACLAVLAGRTMQLDHCHRTNRVRAFLCGHCNTALGRMDDDVAKIRGLADYAERQHAIEAGLPNP